MRSHEFKWMFALFWDKFPKFWAWAWPFKKVVHEFSWNFNEILHVRVQHVFTHAYVLRIPNFSTNNFKFVTNFQESWWNIILSTWELRSHAKFMNVNVLNFKTKIWKFLKIGPRSIKPPNFSINKNCVNEINEKMERWNIFRSWINKNKIEFA